MDLVPFVTILIILIVVGFLLWVVNNYIPMDRKIRQILNIVVFIAVVLWVCNLFGIFDFVRGVYIGN